MAARDYEDRDRQGEVAADEDARDVARAARPLAVRDRVDAVLLDAALVAVLAHVRSRWVRAVPAAYPEFERHSRVRF